MFLYRKLFRGVYGKLLKKGPGGYMAYALNFRKVSLTYWTLQ